MDVSELADISGNEVPRESVEKELNGEIEQERGRS
jgi:hypothetical protein